MVTRVFQQSFVGGEVSPRLYGRIGDAAYQNGVRVARNAIIEPQGPAARRPGTEFVAEVKDITKTVELIEFQFSVDEMRVIEFGAGYFRFYSNGQPVRLSGTPAAWANATNYAVRDLVSRAGVNYYCKTAHTSNLGVNDPPNASFWHALTGDIYEIPNTYTEAQLPDVAWWQSGDVVRLAHVDQQTRDLRRFSDTSWDLIGVNFAPTVSPPSPVTATATRGESIIITSASGSPTTFTAANAMGLTVGSVLYAYGFTNTTPAAYIADGVYIVDDSPSAGTTAKLRQINGTAVSGTGTYSANSGKFQPITAGEEGVNRYIVTSVSPSGQESIGSSPVSVTNPLSAANAYNTLSFPAVGFVDGTVAGYNIYRETAAGVFGFLAFVANASGPITYVDDGSTDPSLTSTPPIPDTTLGSNSQFPRTGCFFDQRGVFAAPSLSPQTVWLSVLGSNEALTYTFPVRDTNRIVAPAVARQNTVIRHCVPMSSLILLTNNAEYRLSALNGDAIAPGNISLRVQSTVGASRVRPQVLGGMVLFTAERGAHLYAARYEAVSDAVVPTDLSVRAAHLVDGYEFVDMAVQREPHPIVWLVRSDGVLVGLTMLAEENVRGWHQHTTTGTFERVACISEGGQDRTYFVVRRTIGGVQRRYIERSAPYRIATLADMTHVDCAVTVNSGTPVSSVTHAPLNGQRVTVIADGVVTKNVLVTANTVALSKPARKVRVGLPFDSDVELLPLTMQVDGYAQGRTKTIDRVELRVADSGAFFVGPDASRLVVADTPGTSLATAPVRTLTPSVWGPDGELLIRSDGPAPLTLVSAALTVTLGG